MTETDEAARPDRSDRSAQSNESGTDGPVDDRRHHPLARYILYRIGISILMIIGVTMVTFLLANVVPGDPAAAALGERAAGDPEIVAAYRAENGLDKPLPEQYITYVSRLVRGDFGTSIQNRQPVRSDLAKAFPATIELAVTAIIVSTLIAVSLGLWAALRRGRTADQLIRAFSLVGISVPLFWLAMVAYYFLFFRLRIFPGSGRLAPTLKPPPQHTGLYTVDALIDGDWQVFVNAVQHLMLPAFALGLYTVGLLTRFIRSAVLEVLDQDYVLAARAKGLPMRRVIFTYVLRGAAVPILTVVALAFGGLLSGTVLVEQIFSWHGLGQYAYQAATRLDLPAIMGVAVTVGVIYILINLVTDLLYGVLDPRVRVS